MNSTKLAQRRDIEDGPRDGAVAQGGEEISSAGKDLNGVIVESLERFVQCCRPEIQAVALASDANALRPNVS